MGVGPPLEVGFGADEYQQGAGLVLGLIVVEVVLGPARGSLAAPIDAGMRSDVSEVVELFGSISANFVARNLRTRKRNALVAASAASGQPANATRHRGQFTLRNFVFDQAVHKHILASDVLYFTSIAGACQTRSQHLAVGDQPSVVRPGLTSMHRMEGIHHPHPNLPPSRGKGLNSCPHPSPLPEGEGTLRLWAADGGVFALGGEWVGEDGGVVGGGGIGELLERV